MECRWFGHKLHAVMGGGITFVPRTTIFNPFLHTAGSKAALSWTGPLAVGSFRWKCGEVGHSVICLQAPAGAVSELLGIYGNCVRVSWGFFYSVMGSHQREAY